MRPTGLHRIQEKPELPRKGCARSMEAGRCFSSGIHLLENVRGLHGAAERRSGPAWAPGDCAVPAGALKVTRESRGPVRVC